MKPYDGEIPKIGQKMGRSTIYKFWTIAEGKAIVFDEENVDIKRVSSALYQFKRRYGGEFTSRTLANGHVVVACLKAPTKKHPVQLAEEAQAEKLAKEAKEKAEADEEVSVEV